MYTHFHHRNKWDNFWKFNKEIFLNQDSIFIDTQI